jgi:DNA-binding response OmpR family regulator
VTPRKERILVVEDDPAILDVLRLILEEGGYAVETVADGETLRDFPNGPPDLLLLDIWLSGWDGREICRSLKGREETKNLPIVICSASRDGEKMAREAGADGFLAKPFDLDDLLATVARQLSEHARS